MVDLRKRGRVAGPALLLCSLVLALTGCGSGDTLEAGDDGLTEVEVVMAQSLNTSLANLTVDADLDEAHDLDLKRVTASTGGSQNQMAALISGDVDVAVSGSNTAVDAILQGADIQIIAGLGPLHNSLTMATDVAKRLGVTRESPVEDRLKALKGLKIAAATPGSAGHSVLQVLLRSVGLDPDKDVTLVPLSDNSAIPAGLAQGTYDASFASLGAGEVAVASGDAITLASTGEGDFPVLDDYVAVALYSSRSFIESNPELVESIRSAFIDAQHMAAESPDEAGEALQKSTLAELDPAVYEQSWPQVVASASDGEFSEANWDAFVELFSTEETDYSTLSYEDVVAEIGRS